MLQWKSVAMETADQHLQDMNPDSLLPLEAKRTGETSLLLVLLAARKSSLSHCWMAGWLKTNISQSVLKDWLWLHFRCNYGRSVQNTLGVFSFRYQRAGKYQYSPISKYYLSIQRQAFFRTDIFWTHIPSPMGKLYRRLEELFLKLPAPELQWSCCACPLNNPKFQVNKTRRSNSMSSWTKCPQSSSTDSLWKKKIKCKIRECTHTNVKPDNRPSHPKPEGYCKPSKCKARDSNQFTTQESIPMKRMRICSNFKPKDQCQCTTQESTAM